MSIEPLGRMVVLGSLGVLALCADASAQCNYDVTVLEYPLNCSISSVNTRGLGMNEQGAVVGQYKCPIWTTTEAFLWTPEGGFSTLQRPPGVISASAVDINEQGVICGTMRVDGLGFRGFVYDNGEWTELPTVLPEAGWSFAHAISNSGVVVGDRSVAEDVAPRTAYLWSRADGFVDLGVMDGPISSAAGLTEAGMLVGWTGNGGSISDTFIWWQDKSLTLLGPIPGGLTSTAHAVSENGLIVGRGRIPMKGFSTGIPRAFVWKNGVFTLIGTLPDHLRSAALDANDLGQIVGSSWTVIDNPNIFHAFLYQNGAMTNLNTLISPGLNINISTAWKIGEDGTILASATNTAMAILTPIDPPVGDLDLDCRVGIIDFLSLLANWGPCPGPLNCPADLDGDGVVDLLDFSILLDNWG